jgi:DNA end-binding protein Ku
MIALDPRDKGIMGTLLRYPYEVRDEKDYFADIPNIKIDKEMLDLAKHIVQTKSGHFEPEKFEDRYESALKELIKKKAAGEKIEVPERPKESNVVSLMDALKRSLEAENGKGKSATEGKSVPRGGKSASHPRRKTTTKKMRKAS